jgi:hypothetical protein
VPASEGAVEVVTPGGGVGVSDDDAVGGRGVGTFIDVGVPDDPGDGIGAYDVVGLPVPEDGIGAYDVVGLPVPEDGIGAYDVVGLPVPGDWIGAYDVVGAPDPLRGVGEPEPPEKPQVAVTVSIIFGSGAEYLRPGD